MAQKPPTVNEEQYAKLVKTAYQLVEKVTNPSMGEPDWDWTTKLVDFMKYYGGLEGARQVLKALKRRWRTGAMSIQTLVLDSVDFCVRGAGKAFAFRLAGAELWRDLKDAAKMKTVKKHVHEKLLLLVREWAILTKMPAYVEFYEKLQSRRYGFSPRTSYNPPPQYIPLTKRKDMDAAHVEKLEAAERDVEEQSVVGDDPGERDDDLPDHMVQTRVPSFDLINLLDLDFEDPPPNAAPPPMDDPFAPATPAGTAPGSQPAPPPGPAGPFKSMPLDENLFGASAPPAPPASGANPFGNPFGTDPPAAPAAAPEATSNSFGNPFGGAAPAPAPAPTAAPAAANPFGGTTFGVAPTHSSFSVAPTQASYSVAPTSASFQVPPSAYGLPQGAASFSVGQQGPGSFSVGGAQAASFSVGQGVWAPYPYPYGQPSGGSFVAPQQGGWGMVNPSFSGQPMQPPTVSDTLASIPPPQKPKDPLADLLS